MNKILVVLASMGLVACGAGKNKTNVEIAQGMFDQISVKSQDWTPNKKDNATVLVPPEGTVPRGFKPYPFTKEELSKAEASVTNPLRGKFDRETLSIGKKHYEVYCGICHGQTGAADGPVAGKMLLPPPALSTGKVVNYSDARIHHAIVRGYGLMGSYSRQILKEEDRWAVVNYIRNLQKMSK